MIGMVGAGKSTLLKCLYVERPLLLRNRCAVVVDKKLRNGGGRVRRTDPAVPGGAVPVRPERPGHLHLHEPAGRHHPGRRRGGGAAATVVRVRGTRRQRGAHRMAPQGVGVAYRLTMQAFQDGRTLVMPDLLDRFDQVVDDPTFRRYRPATLDVIEQAAISMMFRFERLLEDDLQGMFDRETSKHVAAAPEAHHVRRQRVTGGRAGDRVGDGDGELLVDGDAGPAPPAGDAHQLRGRGGVASGGRARGRIIRANRNWPAGTGCRWSGRGITSPTTSRARTRSR